MNIRGNNNWQWSPDLLTVLANSAVLRTTQSKEPLVFGVNQWLYMIGRNGPITVWEIVISNARSVRVVRGRGKNEAPASLIRPTNHNNPIQWPSLLNTCLFYEQ